MNISKFVGGKLFDKFTKFVDFETELGIENVDTFTVDVYDEPKRFEQLRYEIASFLMHDQNIRFLKVSRKYGFDNDAAIADFFKHFVEYNNELSNAKLTFKQFDKVLRVFNEKCETILRPSLEICQLSSISNASNSFRRVFTIRELFDCALFDFKHYVMNFGAVKSYYTDSEVFFDFVSKYTGYLDFLFAKSYEARKNIIEVLDRIDDSFVTPDKKRYVSKIANRNVIKVLDTNNNKIKELYLSCQEAWKIMYGENSLSSLERFFNIAFFRLLYRMAESHFYAEMDVNPRLAHLETIK